MPLTNENYTKKVRPRTTEEWAGFWAQYVGDPACRNGFEKTRADRPSEALRPLFTGIGLLPRLIEIGSIRAFFEQAFETGNQDFRGAYGGLLVLYRSCGEK